MSEQKKTIAVITDNPFVSMGLQQTVGDVFEVQHFCRRALVQNSFTRKVDLVLLVLESNIWESGILFVHAQAARGKKVIVWDASYHAVRERYSLQLGACDYFIQQTAPTDVRQRLLQNTISGPQAVTRLVSLMSSPETTMLPKILPSHVAILEKLHADPYASNETLASEIYLSTGRVKNTLTEIYTRFKVSTRHKLIVRMRELQYFKGCLPLLQLLDGEPRSLPARSPTLPTPFDYRTTPLTKLPGGQTLLQS